MNINVLICIIVIYLKAVVPYKEYQQLIPNGDKVPDPCHHDQIWHGVGHKNKAGGGQRNQFGDDFLRLGKQWNKELCVLDSDGDGKTNGAELGDPHCTWSHNAISFDNISNPGICEPLNSLICRKYTTWGPCFEQCPSTQEKETRNITLRFPRTSVPSHTTTYMCLVFDFPQDGDYHVVATKPVIDNHRVMHHILLFGCDETDGEIKEEMYKPFTCGMIADPKCSSVIGIWSLGISGECSHNQSGFRIGIHGFKKGAIQIHWNNPQLVEGMTDGSGMTVFYTPMLRPHDAGIMIVGQYWIDLPPRKVGVTVTAECSSECSHRLIKNQIYITGVYNHMHYLGRQERIELYRNGMKIIDLAYDRNYSYDSPVLHRYCSKRDVEWRVGQALVKKTLHTDSLEKWRVVQEANIF